MTPKFREELEHIVRVAVAECQPRLALTVAEAAKALKISETKLRQWTDSGELAGIAFRFVDGFDWRYSVDGIKKRMAEQALKAPQRKRVA